MKTSNLSAVAALVVVASSLFAPPAWANEALDKVIRATVRVEMNRGTRQESLGTGTLVETPPEAEGLLRENEVLCISAGHVLETMTVRGSAHVTTPKLDSEGRVTGFATRFTARLLDFESDGSGGDVGLLAVYIPPQYRESVHLAQVHLDEVNLGVEETVFLAGCAGGSAPKIVKARALQYSEGSETSSPAVHLSEERKSGDSGGGMFNQTGVLLGVCSGSGVVPGGMEIGFGLRGFRPAANLKKHFGASSCFTPTRSVKPLLQRLTR